MPVGGVADKSSGAAVARNARHGQIVQAENGGAPVEDRTLLVFADYVCPFCYLAESALAQLDAAGAVTVETAAFELRPAGTVLPSVDEPWMREAWVRTVEPLAVEMNVEMTYPPLVARTRKAHEAAAYAEAQGAGAAMRQAIYRAYWRQGRDIGRIDVLMELARDIGLEPAGMKVALDIDQWTERVERDLAWAAQLGVRAVPAYLLTQRREDASRERGPSSLRTGLQRHEELLDWIMVGHDI
jgi:predicted DsbA family dithiol-disulfide isomerase